MPMSSERRPKGTTPPTPPEEDEMLELEVVEPDGTRSRVICAALEGNKSPPRGTRAPS
jgi:hypothetical protein